MPSIKLKKKTAEYLAEKEKEARALEQSKAAAAAVAAPKVDPPARENQSQAKSHEKPKRSFLQAEVLTEKRKRTVPPTELKLQAWLSENFEKKENVYISTNVMYEYYTESCLLESSNVVDVPHFNRVIRDNLGKTFGLTEASVYKGSIKERKKLIKPKVKAESLSLKMKDIIEEALKDAGNPKKGVRFVWIKNFIATKYPALRVDLQPLKLKSALERGMRYGHIELVKGIGQCGYYRDPNSESTKEEDEKPVKKEKSKKENKDDDKTNGTTDEAEDKEKVEKKGKSRKRKRKGESEEESEKEAVSGAEETNDAKKPKKKKKGKSKKRKVEKWRGESLKHSDPHRIEDTFSLAITYMSEPKEASVTKIKQYITNYYPSINVDLRLKKALEKGVEGGLWEQVRGTNATSGTYRLIADEINPTYSESLEDMISQAILAAHEPKQASANLIKKYVVEFHPNFPVENRPHLFRCALERAINRHKIRQLSGIGATGTFQLVDSFIPSPAILAGESEDEQDIEDSGDEAGERYVVRKTKSRSGGIPVTVISKRR